MMKEADTIVLTDLSNKISLPVGLDFSTHYQNGEEVKTLFLERTAEVQICLNCLDKMITGRIGILKDKKRIVLCNLSFLSSRG